MSQQQDQQHMNGERRLAQIDSYEGPERRKPMRFEEPGGSVDDQADLPPEDEQQRMAKIRDLES